MRPWGRRDAAADPTVWARHEERAGAVVGWLLDLVSSDGVTYQEMRATRDRIDRLFTEAPEIAGSGLMLLVRATASNTLPMAMATHLNDLTRQPWTVDREDALLAARTVVDAPDAWEVAWALKAVEVMLRRAAGDQALDDAEAATLRQLIDSVERRVHLAASDRNGVRTKLMRLLPPTPAGEVDTSAIAPADAWSAAVLPDLVTSDHSDQVTSVLRHLTAASGSKPSQRWLTTATELVSDGTVTDVVRLLVEGLVSADGIARPSYFGGDVSVVLDEKNADVARAAVWATVPISQPWVVPTLQRLAHRGIHQNAHTGWLASDKVPNAAILALGRISTPGAVAALQRLSDGTTNNGFRKRIAAALGVAAEASGLSPSQLVERTVPDGGLDEDGTVTVTVGGVSARASVDQRLTVAVAWQTSVGWTSRKPNDLPADAVSAVRRSVKELRDLLGTERRRVEGLLATDRTWDLEEWRRYYLDHLVTGRVACRLIWIFDDGSGPVSGMPVDEDTVRTLGGDAALPRTGSVRLWHPATTSTDEVSAWRSLLLEAEVVQPFKQAFREVYLLTPAERETQTYSNRFAAHVLRYQQAYALFKERAWPANYLGPYDGGYNGRARHDFPDAGLTVMFEHFQVDPEAGATRPDLCSTDRVWFCRTGDRSKEAVPLEDVPPLVFSEAMRDVDLFVGVTSIALDPTWADRGGDPHYGYWLATSFGELSAVAEVRRDVLATLLPKLAIADRVELADRYVRVHGTKATYKVHLGSANIQVEPDDRYLCIVPARTGRTTHVMLPFEGDAVLAVVLSKVLMLASDDKITDPSIVQQIERRT